MATLSSVDSIYKVRILLLGDTGVGKSSILNWIVNSNFDTSDTNANSDSNSNFPTPSSPDNYAQNDGNHGLNITMGGGGGSFASGVNFGVRLHHHPPSTRHYWLEFIEVPSLTSHPASRKVFYQSVNGIILVHDLSNKKSYGNLWKWIGEVMEGRGRDDILGGISTVGGKKGWSWSFLFVYMLENFSG